MRITAVEGHVLLAPNYDPRFTSSAQDSFVVVLRTDEGGRGDRRDRRQPVDREGLP
jgi:hypothetical protein